jgi:predicted transcriptional regulator
MLALTQFDRSNLDRSNLDRIFALAAKDVQKRFSAVVPIDRKKNRQREEYLSFEACMNLLSSLYREVRSPAKRAWELARIAKHTPFSARELARLYEQYCDEFFADTRSLAASQRKERKKACVQLTLDLDLDFELDLNAG